MINSKTYSNTRLKTLAQTPAPSILALITLALCSLLISCEPKIEKPKLLQPNKTLNKEAYNVAFLVMDGVYNTELTAPMDVFHHTRFRDSIKPMNVFLIAKSLQLVTTFEGLTITPDFSYNGSFPKINILVVPSAEHHLDTDLDDTQMIEFVAKTAETAQFVTSHCDGAFVLAKAGLLDGIHCTTFPSDIGTMRQMFPKARLHENTLFVRDGKYITSAGGAKSFEAALYLCEHLYGKKVANQIAGGLVIDWNLDLIPHIVMSHTENEVLGLKPRRFDD
ncbi:MAG: DJ-1/PfpI family protein [Bacteroidetes bacterium]|nr:DJ-1/PfpI family protein [Bacteroidota bacterium]